MKDLKENGSFIYAKCNQGEFYEVIDRARKVVISKKVFWISTCLPETISANFEKLILLLRFNGDNNS